MKASPQGHPSDDHAVVLAAGSRKGTAMKTILVVLLTILFTLREVEVA